MELLGKLIEAALVVCYDHCVIDWLPDDGAPESFIAECEIELNPWTGRDFYVQLAGVICFIAIPSMQVWHSEKMEVEELV